MDDASGSVNRVLISAADVLDIGAGHPFLSHQLIWRATGPDTWRFARGIYGIFLDVVPAGATCSDHDPCHPCAPGAADGPARYLDLGRCRRMSPGASPGSAGTRLTTCGGHAYPGLGIDAPVAYGSIDEIQALEPALIRFADVFPGSSDWPWRLAGRDATGMLFLAPTDAYGPPGWMSVEVTAAGNGPGNASMGQCDPRVVPSADLGAADWWLDTHEPAPDAASTELQLLVLERACASGSSAEGRIADPAHRLRHHERDHHHRRPSSGRGPGLRRQSTDAIRGPPERAARERGPCSTVDTHHQCRRPRPNRDCLGRHHPRSRAMTQAR